MELLVGAIALLIAIWQLKLQRQEIIRNGKISTLVHMATIIKDKIDHHEKIIENQKSNFGKWKGHADRVNNELRPLLEKLNKEIIDTTASYNVSLTTSDIKELITQKSQFNNESFGEAERQKSA
ncbi:hypothetical protein [Marinobacterium arenosum]|uniref:hypothetical protein n=1 Tax=Marinobacterium arenosum TaxID=2862496 RepID=UPI001C939B18|nr:hypothetical protein [Marinobacterium arenosum]MBY4678570.1 hypothetical protein [Marinobacterium arenosum]